MAGERVKRGGGGGGELSRSYAVSAPAEREAIQLYYSILMPYHYWGGGRGVEGSC